MNSKELLSRLSFSQLIELIRITDPLKRSFYEIECIKGNWAVRELKAEEFNHFNFGQLNTYLNYYKKNEMQPDDNPPVGILLCTDKNHSLVEYATAGMDNNLFVSKYQMVLPSKEALQKFIENEVAKRA